MGVLRRMVRSASVFGLLAMTGCSILTTSPNEPRMSDARGAEFATGVVGFSVGALSALGSAATFGAACTPSCTRPSAPVIYGALGALVGGAVFMAVGLALAHDAKNHPEEAAPEPEPAPQPRRETEIAAAERRPRRGAAVATTKAPAPLVPRRVFVQVF
jgi:hypothetical protein